MMREDLVEPALDSAHHEQRPLNCHATSRFAFDQRSKRPNSSTSNLFNSSSLRCE
jgi:hypothetical protein